MSEAKLAEVIPETAIAVLVPDNLSALVKEADQPVYKAMSAMDSLDWKALKPNQMAVLLMQKPLPSSGGGTMYLTFKQALYYAVRCFELGVSPFSSEVWFDATRFSVNLTLEGKRTVARNRGLEIGPPMFEEVTREWTALPKAGDTAEAAKKMGFAKDLGIRCKMRVGPIENKEFCEYLCWLSEWLQPKSPVWVSKPTHMLQTRATEKCISLALGTGASEAVD